MVQTKLPFTTTSHHVQGFRQLPLSLSEAILFLHFRASRSRTSLQLAIGSVEYPNQLPVKSHDQAVKIYHGKTSRWFTLAEERKNKLYLWTLKVEAKRTVMMICAESNQQRISFAGDLGQSDKAAPMEPQPSGSVRRDTTLLDSSNPDFEFRISRNFDPGDSSPADEIFADGMILPILPFQVTTASSAMPKRLYKYELPPLVSSLPPPPLPLPQNSSEKETPGSGANSDSEAEKSSKSFWSFRRSSSLNCDIKKSLICSFPRLTRSNSTGSVMNSKRAMLRDINKHSSQRHGVPRPRADPSSHLSSPSSVCCSSYQFRPQKHAGKNVGREGGGSFRIAPVIGGPSPFWLGSILRLSKEKKTKNK